MARVVLALIVVAAAVFYMVFKAPHGTAPVSVAAPAAPEPASAPAATSAPDPASTLAAASAAAAEAPASAVKP